MSVPTTAVVQFWFPKMALSDWVVTGATAAISEISVSMASASASLKSEAPEAWPGPIRLPAVTMSMLLPRLAICCLTWRVAPPPMVTMVITAPTPITMPRMVRKERRTLRLISRRARRMVLPIIRIPSHWPDPMRPGRP